MALTQAESIVQRHIRGIVGLEESQSSIMLKQYRKAADELKTRLLITPDDTFTEARIETTLAQLDLYISVLEQRLQKIARDGHGMATDQGIEDTVNEINKFERKFSGAVTEVPLGVIETTVEPRNVLLNQYNSSIVAYHRDLRSNIQRRLTQGLIQRKTYGQVVLDIEEEIKGSAWQAHRITRTELHNIYNVSKLDSMTSVKERFIPDLMKMLVHPMDNRTGSDSKALSNKNPIVEIYEPFKFKWNGETRVFMNPPDRPNDRAIMIPVRKSYFN